MKPLLRRLILLWSSFRSPREVGIDTGLFGGDRCDAHTARILDYPAASNAVKDLPGRSTELMNTYWLALKAPITGEGHHGQ